MSEEPREQDPGTDEELRENEEGVGLGMDDEPNTFEPEEDPEATDPPD